MLKHGYGHGYHNGYSGTGTGTMKWVWVRVRVPSHVETRVRVGYRYGYHNGYSGTCTGTNFGTWVRVLHLCQYERRMSTIFYDHSFDLVFGLLFRLSWRGVILIFDMQFPEYLRVAVLTLISISMKI